jgi:hypothetical protein
VTSKKQVRITFLERVKVTMDSTKKIEEVGEDVVVRVLSVEKRRGRRLS